MGVRSLGLEDLLEEGMATHPSILAWRIPWMKEPGGLQSMRSQESGMTERLHHHHHPSFIQFFKGAQAYLLPQVRERV